MPSGAAVVAAEQYGAAEVVDPRPFFVGELAQTLAKYPHIGKVVPAMGYSEQQVSWVYRNSHVMQGCAVDGLLCMGGWVWWNRHSHADGSAVFVVECIVHKSQVHTHWQGGTSYGIQ
jgi:predicted GTPase